MKRIIIVFSLITFCATGLFAAGMQTPEELYQDGLYKETALGDLKAAIGVYEELLTGFAEHRAVAAKAQLRIGICYETLGKGLEARSAYQKTIYDFADQEEVCKQAKECLKRLDDKITIQSPLPSISLAVLDFDISMSIQNREDVQSAITIGLINNLSNEKSIRVVEREKIGEAMKELKLSAEGKVSPETALKIGRITGAKLIIAGEVAKISDELIISARLINTETTELAAVQVSGDFKKDFISLVNNLSEKIIQRIAREEEGILLAAMSEEERDNIEEKKLKEKIAGKDLPRLLVIIPETHQQRYIPDPAGEIEMLKWFSNCEFPVISEKFHFGEIRPSERVSATQQPEFNLFLTVRRKKRNLEAHLGTSPQLKDKDKEIEAMAEKIKRLADVLIVGEAYSELGNSAYGLISCKGRIEVRLIDVKSGTLLAAASEKASACGISEEIAGKSAIQRASRNLAIKIIPVIVERWSNGEFSRNN